ncbi:MAG TPA: Uma2 family endonuclease [Dehalococcoidia bacterium]|nr:Uma2 family endonuclease [Dehalococcoidia bacterium]
MVAELVERRFTLDEYERMVDAGIFDEDEHIELLDGKIVCMAAIGARHSVCVMDLHDWFYDRLRGRAKVRTQNPIRLPPRASPEPDVALVRLRADNYRSGHPNPEDVLLVIEVADSSLAIDRYKKLLLYAAAGIPETWIFDLNADRALVHREPRDGVYTNVTVVERGGPLSPLAFPELALALDELLGPPTASE